MLRCIISSSTKHMSCCPWWDGELTHLLCQISGSRSPDAWHPAVKRPRAGWSEIPLDLHLLIEACDAHPLDSDCNKIDKLGACQSIDVTNACRRGQAAFIQAIGQLILKLSLPQTHTERVATSKSPAKVSPSTPKPTVYSNGYSLK